MQGVTNALREDYFMGMRFDRYFQLLDYGPHIDSNDNYISTNSAGSEILRLPKETSYFMEHCFARHTPNIILIPKGCKVICSEYAEYDKTALKAIVFNCEDCDSSMFYNVCSTYTPQTVRLYLDDGSKGLPMAYFGSDVEMFEVYCNNDLIISNLFHLVGRFKSRRCGTLKLVSTGKIVLYLNNNAGHDGIERLVLGKQENGKVTQQEEIDMERLSQLMNISSALPIKLDTSKGNYFRNAFLNKISAGVRCAVFNPEIYQTFVLPMFDAVRMNKLLNNLKSLKAEDCSDIITPRNNSKDIIEFELSEESIDYNTKDLYSQLEEEFRVFSQIMPVRYKHGFIFNLLRNMVTAQEQGLIKLNGFSSLIKDFYGDIDEMSDDIKELLIQFGSLSDNDTNMGVFDTEFSDEFALY